MAAEPAEKRLKTGLPLCAAHRSSAGSRARHNLQAAVEEALCGVSSLLWDGAYRLQALVRQQGGEEPVTEVPSTELRNFCITAQRQVLLLQHTCLYSFTHISLYTHMLLLFFTTDY